jgi:hypothetical protein
LQTLHAKPGQFQIRSNHIERIACRCLRIANGSRNTRCLLTDRQSTETGGEDDSGHSGGDHHLCQRKSGLPGTSMIEGLQNRFTAL